MLAKKKQYIKRHDSVFSATLQHMPGHRGVKLDKEHWYEHVPKSVQTSQEG